MRSSGSAETTVQCALSDSLEYVCEKCKRKKKKIVVNNVQKVLFIKLLYFMLYLVSTEYKIGTLFIFLQCKLVALRDVTKSKVFLATFIMNFYLMQCAMRQNRYPTFYC